MRHIAFFRGICGKHNRQTDIKCKRQTTPRMDRHETIVTGRCETFRYCHIGGKGMTSAELKHRVKLQEWAARIQDCRSSGLSVRVWCRQEEINATTYYRWERNCWLWLKQSRARACRPSGLQSFRHRNGHCIRRSAESSRLAKLSSGSA